MGIYVNPGSAAFQRALNSEIYVDKTDLIAVTNSRIDTMNCYMCVSRPRRFGKSMAADMLVAYYSKGCDSRILFAGKKIEADGSMPMHLNRHNVIRLDIQQFLFQESHLDIFINKIRRCNFPDPAGYPYRGLGSPFLRRPEPWQCGELWESPPSAVR